LGSLPAEVGLAIESARVADLFAGSGAFGIEALSRGAAHAVFVDSDGLAIATIRDNLETLSLDPGPAGSAAGGAAGTRARVVRSDVLRWLRSAPPFDLILADPPYAFDQWPALADLLAPVAGVAVLESAAPLPLGPGWELLREKHYGGTVVTVARPACSPALPAPARDQKGDA
jgi:16S rRNA (guanine966-N2)-methyltransferase